MTPDELECKAREDFIVIISRVTSIWAHAQGPTDVMEDEKLASTATDLLAIVGGAVGLYEAAVPSDCCHMDHYTLTRRLKASEAQRERTQ